MAVLTSPLARDLLFHAIHLFGGRHGVTKDNLAPTVTPIVTRKTFDS